MTKTKGLKKTKNAGKKHGMKMQHFKHVSFLIEASELETLPEGLRDRNGSEVCLHKIFNFQSHCKNKNCEIFFRHVVFSTAIIFSMTITER